MKKLTKKERKEIYEKALVAFSEQVYSSDQFLCNIFQEKLQIPKESVFEILPEFNMCRPIGHEYDDPFDLYCYNKEADHDMYRFGPTRETILCLCAAMCD